MEQVVDVGLEPAAKERLLGGQLNIVTCPRCGNGGRMNVPLLYHDPAPELLLVYVPMDLNLPQPQREQLIGGLMRNLMSRIPSEARRGYLFNPQIMLTMDSLLDRVLEADGIPTEVLEVQRKRSQLLNRLISAPEETLKSLVEAHDDEIDDSFFQMLSTLIRSASQAGRAEEADYMLRLRNRLLTLASWSRHRGITARTLDEQQARFDLLDRLLAAEDSEWPALARQHDAEVDYLFFQLLTAMADGAPQELAERLIRLRSLLLEQSSAGQDVTAGQEVIEDLRTAAETAGGLNREMLLEKILTAEEDAVVEALASVGSPLLDYSFFLLMADKIDDAVKRGDQREATHITELRDKLVGLTGEWEKARVARTRKINRQIDGLLENQHQEVALTELLPEIDQFFLSVLATRIEVAEKAGHDQIAVQLKELFQEIVVQIQAHAPPEIRLINELLEIENEEAILKTLEKRKNELSPSTLQLMEQMLEELRENRQDALAAMLATIIELTKMVLE